MRPLARAALVLWGAVCACAALAADPPAAPAAPPAALEIGGRTVAVLRASFAGYTPADRVQGARARIGAAYGKNPRPALAARHVAEGSQVLADGAIMFIIVAADVNGAGGETPAAAADYAVDVLRHVVEERTERRDPVALARGAGFAVVASLVAYLLLRLVFALDGRVGTVFSRRVAERAGDVKVKGVSMFDRSHMLRLARQTVRGFAWLGCGFVLYLWLNAVLESFPFTRPWGDRLTGATLGALSAAAKASLDALPGLLVVVLILALARLATQVVGLFFDEVVESNARIGWLDRHTARPTRILFTLLAWIFAIAMAYPYLPGSDSRAFQGLSVLVGLMVSFGASSLVGQAASGLILMYTSAFRVGDYVRIGAHEGTVIEIGIFVTRVRTGMGDEVMLPNNVVVSGSTRNYSREAIEPGFVLNADVTIGYDTPWRQVHAMLEEAAKRTPGVLGVPPPRAYQAKLSDFYAEYRLWALCGIANPAERAQAVSRLNGNIQDVFNEHGVQILSPHHLGDPDRPKIVPKSEWFRAPARPEQDPTT